MSDRWICPVCNANNPEAHTNCVTCWPTVVNRPTPAPTSLPVAASEVMQHLAVLLRKMKQELDKGRLSAHQLGVMGYGLKHVAEELAHCAERLEKELEDDAG